MTYEEHMKKQKEEDAKVKAELEKIIASHSVADLKKRFCRDFGCINFKTDMWLRELKLARAFHDMLEELEPGVHHITETEPYRCYHVMSCCCGYSEACDSSD